MLAELGIDCVLLFAAAPVVLITANQVRAIFNRDNHTCVFPFPHDCRGKLTVHHIDGKEDKAENLASVCHEAHWEYLHNGASAEQKTVYRDELFSVVQERTEHARENGWIFPDLLPSPANPG